MPCKNSNNTIFFLLFSPLLYRLLKDKYDIKTFLKLSPDNKSSFKQILTNNFMIKSKTHKEQLADYIITNIKKGYTMDSLKYSLISQGYSKISVENAIDLANQLIASEIPPIKEKPQITHKIIRDDEEEIITSPIQEKKGFWSELFG